MSELDLFTAAGDGLAVEHFGLAEDGTPFVQAPAFARALKYSRTSDALKMLDDEEKGTAICRTPGGPQRMTVIYEDGIWELIFRSTLPSAKTLKSRVKQILRELRETGVVDTREKPMSELEMAERYVAALKRNAELEPAARSWNELASADGDYSVREAAQILNRDPSISTGQRRLFATLRQIGWIDLTSGLPYQRQLDLGRLSVRAGSYVDAEGDRVPTRQARVTVKGLHELHKRLGGSGDLLLVG
ncbi:phage antirepressor KilAC domain-containing protein [Amycolatopsis sp. FU40]|uniref:phage antirepressor n=1 Tax=Amycolatopsis sp. FU40 TaxID=2914159 RepID=UPI001F014C02|nr:phage antirepressor KilAC domain-containing protein [Amycolatopsis sp. FU40]UKD55100.1 phage antirepressor KilAC domain-containing protein [Amycolatopsis sp. FU40]